MRIRTFVILCIFVFCLFDISKAETIKISAVDYPPFSSSSVFEEIGHGIVADIVDEMFSMTGHEAEMEYLPHRRSTYLFEKKVNPFIANSLKIIYAAGIKPDQIESISLGFYNAYFFYLKSRYPEEITYATYADLKGLRVCVTRGSYIIPVLKKSGVEVEASNTNDSCVKKLASNRVDLWGSIDLTAWFIVRKFYPHLKDDLAHITPSKNSYWARDELVLSYMKSDTRATKIAEELYEVFQSMKRNGALIKIMKRYWGEKIPKDVLPLDMQ